MDLITLIAISEGVIILWLAGWLYTSIMTIKDLSAPKLTKEQRRSKK